MAPKPDRLAFIFEMVLAIAMVATWAASLNTEQNSVAPIPPRETTYRPGGCTRQTVPGCLKTVAAASDVASAEGFSPRLSFSDR